MPRTTSQQFIFTIVLISESFYYTSQEDYEFELPTIITRKHIGILLLECRTMHMLTYILGNVVTQLPNFPFESTNQFITTYIVPQIKLIDLSSSY
jgi:hypothetical protein